MGDLPVFNSASVENKGFEFTVGYRNNWKDWSLDVTANISALRNKVKSLGEGVQPIKAEVMMSGSFNDRPTITKPGLPIGTFGDMWWKVLIMMVILFFRIIMVV